MDALAPASWALMNAAEATADRLNLSPLLRKPCPALSGGERKRAALAAGLVSSPSLLVLDEPTNHLDLAGINYLSAAVRALPRETALLVVTHDRAFLSAISTRILELDAERLFSYDLPPSPDAGAPFSAYGAFLAAKAERLAGEAKTRREEKARLGKELESASCFDQRGLKVESEEVTVIEFLKEIVSEPDEAMRLLKKFNFPKERWFDRVVQLSGGQKRRLQLLEVLAKNPNVLLLDEPSNDLDLNTLEALERFIRDDFDGVVVVVSHDRYLLSKTVDHLFVFEGEGVVKDWVGSMEEYVAMKEEEEEAKKGKNKSTKAAPKSNGDTLKKTNALREIKKLEKKMSALQSEIEKIQKQYDEVGEKGVLSDLQEVSAKLERKKGELGKVEAKWILLEEEVEVMA
ncbi:hypothetical protein TeGR_g2622 [Tetraparma gracilis]|uniref:ABC transporter domain-containing protein n=1 Tax=Tetraparma gracilis TaxID=2962635 RepID=A0ABQ6MJS9_9STRA|nr:hypothetical protein TeGR_g2622 [Tetraparma gracilis]